MIPVVLALSASAAWGISDFLGGVKAKTVPLPLILFVSQAAGLIAIAFVLLGIGESMPMDGRLAFGLLAGVAAVVDLGLIYLVLARGPVILIAPIAALGASIPVAVGLAGGDPLNWVIVAGLGFALLGSLASSYEPAQEEGPGGLLSGLPLALGASAGIAAALILLDAASEADPYWATGALRVGGFMATVVFLAVLALRGSTSASAPISLGIGATLAVVGLCDVAADIGYATASQVGNLSTVAVLASLYPVVTVILGYAVLRERVLPIQVGGVLMAMLGIALLAGASG